MLIVAAGLSAFFMAVLLMSSQGASRLTPRPASIETVFTQSAATEYRLVAFIESVSEQHMGHLFSAGSFMAAMGESSTQFRISPKNKDLAKSITFISVAAIPPCQDTIMASLRDDRPPALVPARSGRIPTGPPALV